MVRTPKAVPEIFPPNADPNAIRPQTKNASHAARVF
jgi:hypothetical protein